MKEYICPFCEEGDMDEIGLCTHLASYCPQYDRACRRTSDYHEDRIDRLEQRQKDPT